MFVLRKVDLSSPSTYWAHSKRHQNKPCSQCCIKVRYITLSNLKGSYITTKCKWLLHRLSVTAPWHVNRWLTQLHFRSAHLRQPDDRKISKCPTMFRRRKPQSYTLTLISIDKFWKWIDNNFTYHLVFAMTTLHRDPHF